MKKIAIVIGITFIVGLLYFRAEHPSFHYSKTLFKEQRTPAASKAPEKLRQIKKEDQTLALPSKLLEVTPEEIKVQENEARLKGIPSKRAPLEEQDTWIKSHQGEYRIREDIGVTKVEFRSDFPQSRILEEKLGFLFVKDLENNESGVLKIVENKDNRALGIVTGVLSLKFKDFDQRDSILSTLEGKVVRDYPHLKLLHLEFDDWDTLNTAHQKASHLSGIERSTIEILEYQKHSK